jgi:hypothetical protein
MSTKNMQKGYGVRKFLRRLAGCDITRELSFNGMLARCSLQSVMISLKVSKVPFIFLIGLHAAAHYQ